MSEYKEHSFDAYCKTILRHAAANAHKARKRQAAKIVPFSCLSSGELKQLCAYDSYSVDKQTYIACGHEVEIADEALCNALERLTDIQRDILILAFCFDLPDIEISQLLSLPRSTVQYRRNTALKYIRKLMEVHDEHTDKK